MNLSSRLLGLLVLGGWCAAAFARLPEPNVIVYGRATDMDGTTLTDHHVVVVGRIHTRECARAVINAALATNVNYALRIPLDDGWASRYADYAARPGDALEIAFLCNEVECPAEGAVPVIGARATLQRADIALLPEPAGALAAAVLVMLRRRHPGAAA
jgi:hypothetical protein